MGPTIFKYNFSERVKMKFGFLQGVENVYFLKYDTWFIYTYRHTIARYITLYR
jgi:hypothetical protein